MSKLLLNIPRWLFLGMLGVAVLATSVVIVGEGGTTHVILGLLMAVGALVMLAGISIDAIRGRRARPT